MSNNKKKKKDSQKRAAAVVFGVGIVAALTMFIVTQNKESEETVPVNNTNTVNESESESQETTQVPEESESKAYVVTAGTEDIISETASETVILSPDDEIVENETESEAADAEESGENEQTVITRRDYSAYNGTSVYIDMENISQKPELPVGCEITALAILLNFWGFDADKVYLANNYLPISSGRYKYEDGKTYKDSFYDYFIGDPFSRGYGCFSNAIEKAANSYISDNGGGYTVKNISGCSPDTLYGYLEEDIPVIVWATDGMIAPEYYETWYDIDTGEQLDWYLNEHCAVLVGFDMSAGTITLNDPMKGIIDYDISKFETRFSEMHSQAIVILPSDTSSYNTETKPEAQAQTEAETQAQTETETETEIQTETETETETEYDDEELIIVDDSSDETTDDSSDDVYEIEIDDG